MWITKITLSLGVQLATLGEDGVLEMNQSFYKTDRRLFFI